MIFSVPRWGAAAQKRRSVRMNRRLPISLLVATVLIAGATGIASARTRAHGAGGGGVPNFDVRPSCRESTVPDCVNQEQVARKALAEKWSSFNAKEKARCAVEARYAGPPSYVEWLTCLQINANARNLSASADNTAANSSAAAALGGATTPEAGSGASSSVTHHSRRRARRHAS
jgi:hypothetical protein